jgi:uncharacterized lipoprotein YmbA
VDEREAQDRRGERQSLRQQLIRAFSDTKAQAVLTPAELKAVNEFFKLDVVPLLQSA